MKATNTATTAKSEQTRQVILAAALLIATSKSLNDVTIGELAKASGLSKSGMYAHFGSKENLQAAIVDYASELFVERVIRNVSTSLPPTERIMELSNRWLHWYEGAARKCLFISATVEFDDRPGVVRDAIHAQIHRWIAYLEAEVARAIQQGEFNQDSNAEQFVFELYSLFLGSQKYYWLGKEDRKRGLFKTGLEQLISNYCP
jgi:AcrR family transcriptional regulator